MSVAFRRDSDEEHKEPRFELPIPAGPNLVTKRGLSLIEDRIRELDGEHASADATRREEIARALRYWHTRRVTAVVAPPPPLEEIAFGSCFRVRIEGTERRLQIVGDDEADPGAGLIAFSAPLARALTGAAEGETVSIAGRTNPIEVIELLAD